VHTGNVGTLIISQGLARPRRAAIREGKEIAAYSCGPPRQSQLLNATLRRHQYCRIGPHQRYVATPILLRQTAERLIAARHAPPAYFRNSLLACYGLPGVPREVLLAVLNSGLIGLWYYHHVPDARQRAFPQVKVGHLQSLPCFDPGCLTVRTDVDGDDLGARLSAWVRRMESLPAGEPRARQYLALQIERLVLRLYALPPSLARETCRWCPRPRYAMKPGGGARYESPRQRIKRAGRLGTAPWA
jgi:hypothetical protein